MKHPVRDRIVMLLCALCALAGAAAFIGVCAGMLPLDPVIALLQRVAVLSVKVRVALCVCALVLVILACLKYLRTPKK